MKLASASIKPGTLARVWQKVPMCALLPALLTLVGCGQGDVRVYRVAKEASQPQQTAQSDSASIPPGHPDISSSSPGLTWKLPAGWEEVAPGEMRVASFRIKSEAGKQADVSIVPLPGMAGGQLNNVNRWRGQVGESPVSESELAQLAQPVQIAGQPAQLFEQAGKPPSSDEPTRILGAIQIRNGMAWFFKMTGDDSLVKEQKTAFVDFLKSLSFAPTTAKTDLPPSHPPVNTSALQAPPVSAPGSDEGKPKWQVPSGWKEVSSGQFLVAKFLLPGSDTPPGAVNVSMSAGDGGGLAANVNRWRGQLGLPSLAQSDLEKQVQSLELASGKAMLVDMNGTDSRTGQKSHVLGAIVPQARSTWFYKLMGSEEIVAREKDAFIKFVKTATYE